MGACIRTWTSYQHRESLQDTTVHLLLQKLLPMKSYVPRGREDGRHPLLLEPARPTAATQWPSSETNVVWYGNRLAPLGGLLDLGLEPFFCWSSRKSVKQ